MKEHLTKRKWRRIRGMLIARDYRLSPLRRVKFSNMVMTMLISAYLK